MIDSLRPSPRRRAWRSIVAAPRLPVRTREVLPPSRRDEEMGVFLTAAFIVLCVIYIVGFERGGPVSAPDAAKGRGLLPFQVLFRDLPSPEQRMFRQMQEGALEAIRARAADGSMADGREARRRRDPALRCRSDRQVAAALDVAQRRPSLSIRRRRDAGRTIAGLHDLHRTSPIRRPARSRCRRSSTRSIRPCRTARSST